MLMLHVGAAVEADVMVRAPAEERAAVAEVLPHQQLQLCPELHTVLKLVPAGLAVRVAPVMMEEILHSILRLLLLMEATAGLVTQQAAEPAEQPIPET